MKWKYLCAIFQINGCSIDDIAIEDVQKKLNITSGQITLHIVKMQEEKTTPKKSDYSSPDSAVFAKSPKTPQTESTSDSSKKFQAPKKFSFPFFDKIKLKDKHSSPIQSYYNHKDDRSRNDSTYKRSQKERPKSLFYGTVTGSSIKESDVVKEIYAIAEQYSQTSPEQKGSETKQQQRSEDRGTWPRQSISNYPPHVNQIFANPPAEDSKPPDPVLSQPLEPPSAPIIKHSPQSSDSTVKSGTSHKVERIRPADFPEQPPPELSPRNRPIPRYRPLPPSTPDQPQYPKYKPLSGLDYHNHRQQVGRQHPPNPRGSTAPPPPHPRGARPASLDVSDKSKC